TRRGHRFGRDLGTLRATPHVRGLADVRRDAAGGARVHRRPCAGPRRAQRAPAHLQPAASAAARDRGAADPGPGTRKAVSHVRGCITRLPVVAESLLQLHGSARRGAPCCYAVAAWGNRSNSCGSAPSSLSRNCLVGSPPPKPVSEPSAPITRWQGRTIGSGLRPFAAPTARVAVGRPTCVASCA